MIIHATNTTGLGASHVITSFIEAASNLGILNKAKLYLPDKGPLRDFSPVYGKVIRYKRLLPNSISRLLECYFASYIFPKEEQFIVLGDIPLKGINNQIVLVHQPNLIDPKYNKLSSNSLHYKVYRTLFKMNLKYASWIVVQTDVMKSDLIKSYPALNDKIVVMPQPLPSWFSIDDRLVFKIKKNKDSISLFYPAAGYSHKNHLFLSKLNSYFIENKINNCNFKILLTLTKEEFVPYNHIPFVENLGRLNSEQIIAVYNNCDALLFLSLVESYGLPLVEALKLSLPILTVDLAYSRWMCDDEAYYFTNESIDSFLLAFNKLNSDINKGFIKDYTHVLSKFPNSWESIVTSFIKLF
jgi:hypothetical protein